MEIPVAVMIYKTTNGGTNWITQQSPSSYVLCIRFANANSGYLSTEFQNIFKTTNGGNPIGIQTITTEMPSAFSLSQNYPNPFNPVTKIKFNVAPHLNLPLTGGDVTAQAGAVGVSLVIFDILGRKVAALVNENLKPGEYETEWNASNYASGVYFYQLQAGTYRESKKMLLIK